MSDLEVFSRVSRFLMSKVAVKSAMPFHQDSTGDDTRLSMVFYLVYIEGRLDDIVPSMWHTTVSLIFPLTQIIFLAKFSKAWPMARHR